MLQIEIRSPDLKKEVKALIDSGLYPDPYAVIIDALETLSRSKKSHDLMLQSSPIGKVK